MILLLDEFWYFLCDWSDAYDIIVFSREEEAVADF